MKKLKIEIEAVADDAGSDITINAHGESDGLTLCNVMLQLGLALHLPKEAWAMIAAAGAAGKTGIGTKAQEIARIGGTVPVGPSSGADAPPSPQREGSGGASPSPTGGG